VLGPHGVNFLGEEVEGGEDDGVEALHQFLDILPQPILVHAGLLHHLGTHRVQDLRALHHIFLLAALLHQSPLSLVEKRG
jgi:hypothetical protein